MNAIPHLVIDATPSSFDEAVIFINGHEEETIRIECSGAAELAGRLVAIVEQHHRTLLALKSAMHALRSYEYGNGASELARSVADQCESILQEGNAV